MSAGVGGTSEILRRRRKRLMREEPRVVARSAAPVRMTRRSSSFRTSASLSRWPHQAWSPSISRSVLLLLWFFVFIKRTVKN